MHLFRSIGSALVGYIVFAGSAFAFFQLSGQPPHQPAPVSIMVASIVVGCIAALAGGYVAAFLGGRRPVLHGALVATLLATGAVVSLVATAGRGAIWSQLAALLLMAPSAIAGGYARARRADRA